MCQRLKYKLILYSILIVSITLLMGYSVYFFISKVPEKITLKEGEENILDLSLPFTGEISSVNTDGGHVSSVNFNSPVTITTGKPGAYDVSLKLFGVFYYKDIKLNVVESKTVLAGGIPVGVYLKADGILVVDNAVFADENGMEVSPSNGIINKGDYIISVNNRNISSKMELIDVVSHSGGGPLVIGLKRNDSNLTVKVVPKKNAEGDYKIGLWIKDDVQGIGTLTYVDSDGNFGALGHGISDMDTGEIFNVNDGVLYGASIISIVKGQAGSPGEYVGTIDYSTKNRLGQIVRNDRCGVYGYFDMGCEAVNKFESYPVGFRYEIKEGEAYIISGTDDNLKKYSINIDYVDQSNSNINKGIQFTVTDAKLLSLTNGIVQGMSGSPIIQNGKIIGAVTHVFVNDPTKGYGIFIDSMMR